MIFYPASALISEHSDSYRDFFTSTFPLAEALIDYADDNSWEELGPSTVLGAVQRLTSKETDNSPLGESAPPAKTLSSIITKDVKEGYEHVKEVTKKDVEHAKEVTQKDIELARTKLGELAHVAEDKVHDLKSTSKKASSKADSEGKKAVAHAKMEAEQAAKAVRAGAEHVVNEAKKNGVAFSEGLKEVIDKAEHALDKAKKTAADISEAFLDEDQVQSPDTQLDRKLDSMSGASPEADLAKGGKKPYNGPELPLGFEPPPGYYIPKAVDAAVKPPTATDSTETAPAEKSRPVLPLLAPKVKEFDSSAEEPIIAQLASTIDSLASSLSATSSAASGASADAATSSPPAILSQAQTDLAALADRLKSLKADEKVKLEKSLQEKAAEFDAALRKVQQEWTSKEGELIDGWKEEREKLVDGWRKVLDRELEGQRVGIEQRLREEVVAQGIELQRRWLRSIKAQVESERGGRLAKLDNLTTSFKQLERITLDNSNQLDANVALHTLWSALRAVQAKADRGNLPFDDELRVLKSAAASAIFTQDERTRDIVSTMVESIENSGSASQGVKSFPSLASWFSTTLAPKIQSVSLVPAEHEAGVLSHLASAALSKVLFRRKAGWVEGDDVGAVLARTEYLLNEKDLDGAARELNQLHGWAGKLASDWLKEARKRLEVEQALNVSFEF